MRRHLGWFVLAASVVGYVGCDAGGKSIFGSADDDAASDGGAGGNGGIGGTGTTSGFDPETGSSSSGENTTCDSLDDEDRDADGFTKLDGDCNDCDANVNPNAVEVILDNYGQGGAGGQGSTEPADEDCDGDIDEAPEECDMALAVDSADPFDAARAVGLCKIAPNDPTASGVIDAQWVSVDGSPAPANTNYHFGHGMLTAFGANVNTQQGARMLGLSSGAARQPTDTGYQSPSGFDKGITMNHPQGFPKESPACPNTTTGTPHDGAAVELTIRTPSNAQGFSFDFNFYTYEWPGFVCSTYNDFFVAILDPIPVGQTDGNISFDQLGNPVSVNNAFLEVCGCTSGPPCIAGGKTFTCALGNQELVGTGFGLADAGQDHGATSWLVTQAPVEPNTVIKIRWGTYDSGDGVLDSTTLIDNWRWVAEPGTQVGTEPIPDPQ